MTGKSPSVVPLREMVEGQEADTFVLLVAKDELKTREGKTYWRVTFRDAGRSVTFPIWNDSPHADACQNSWRTGLFYKVRAIFRTTNFGPQLDIKRIRPATDDDRADGYDPFALTPRSRFDALEMYAALLTIACEQIRDAGLSGLVVDILGSHRALLCDLPAATHHHDFRSGFLEHVLSVARNAVFLADKYAAIYPEALPPIGRDLVVAGAILHDIGKLAELQVTPAGTQFTPAGELIGHTLLGRDLVHSAAAQHRIDAETLLRLEHIIVAHQRTPEWGAPRPPMTPEALLVFYADDIDARLQMMVEALQQDAGAHFVTSKQNALKQKVFRGLPAGAVTNEPDAE